MGNKNWALMEMTYALRRIIHARDYHAEHGAYPSEYEIKGDVCFDDWAADIAETVLTAHGINIQGDRIG